MMGVSTRRPRGATQCRIGGASDDDREEERAVQQDRFDEALEVVVRDIVERSGVDALFSIPGVYEALSEALHNEVVAEMRGRGEEE